MENPIRRLIILNPHQEIEGIKPIRIHDREGKIKDRVGIELVPGVTLFLAYRPSDITNSRLALTQAPESVAS